MKKLFLFILFISLLEGSEFEFGKGSMSFTGGMLGLTQTISEDISSYSLISNHSNIGNSKIFYAYNFTWYDSKHLKQFQQIYNTGIQQAQNVINSFSPFTSNLPLIGNAISNTKIFIPTIDYRLQGLDASVSLGYDIVKKDENNYLGIAGYLGISTPWISATKANDPLPISLPTSKKNMIYQYYKDSKTEIETYKIGLAIYSRVKLIPTLSAYLNGIYAYQTGSISNDYAKSDFDVDGHFTSIDMGVRFQPYEKDFDLGWLTLSPRIFVTAGYRHNSWTYDGASINISGMPTIKFPKTNMQIDTDIGYFGVGYSF